MSWAWSASSRATGGSSSSLGADGPDHQGVRHRIHRYVNDHDIPLVDFRPGERKDDIAQHYLAGHDGAEGILFVGRAQEKTSAFRTEKRRNPQTGATFPWLVRRSAMVNHFCLPARSTVSERLLVRSAEGGGNLHEPVKHVEQVALPPRPRALQSRERLLVRCALEVLVHNLPKHRFMWCGHHEERHGGSQFHGIESEDI
jgi:hypothetical protein